MCPILKYSSENSTQATFTLRIWMLDSVFFFFFLRIFNLNVTSIRFQCEHFITLKWAHTQHIVFMKVTMDLAWSCLLQRGIVTSVAFQWLDYVNQIIKLRLDRLYPVWNDDLNFPESGKLVCSSLTFARLGPDYTTIEVFTINNSIFPQLHSFLHSFLVSGNSLCKYA